MGLALGDKGSPAGPASPGQAAQCPAGGHSLGALGTVGPTPGLSVEVRRPPGLSIPAPWTQQRAGAPGCLWKEAQGGGPGTSDTFLSQLGPQSLQDGGRGRGRAPGGCSVPGGFLPTHSPSTSDSHPWQASGVGGGVPAQPGSPSRAWKAAHHSQALWGRLHTSRLFREGDPRWSVLQEASWILCSWETHPLTHPRPVHASATQQKPKPQMSWFPLLEGLVPRRTHEPWGS